MARGAIWFLLLWSSGAAWAGVTRVRWRGVEVKSGTPPARLEAATAAHLALALRSLGAGLVPQPPFDAEAVARCGFAATAPAAARRAQCQVEVVAGELHAERRSDVPYRDADDLAESIALLVSGMLQTDFVDLPPAIEPEPEPKPRPPPPTRPLVLPPPERPPPPRPSTAPAIRKPPAPDSGHLLLSLGPSVAVGFQGEPALWGASLRALYLARRVLRVGGSVVLEGNDVTRSGFDLSFFRMVAAPRLGIGVTSGRVDVDLTAGPALHVLYGHATGASHTLTSFAVVAGARLGVGLSDGLALEVGVDVAASLQEERVAAGPAAVTTFGRWWLDVALALVYRR